MSYFLLPNINKNNIIEDINIEIGNSTIIINKSLTLYLYELKKQIDNYNLSWDIYKKYTNPYEYIDTTIQYTKFSVCKLNPLSRSFYKLLEIYNIQNILDKYNNTTIKTFHLAEGPGGFIEATQYIRQNDSDTYYGMTLIDKNDNIPGWKKSQSFLSKHNNIIIEYGEDKTGDLFNVNNLWYCYNKYKNSMDIITGDGGFDFSIDYNNQEVLSNKLIFSQICFAIAMQKKGGVFILKMFDIFHEASIDILYILSCFYKIISIIKPNTSRFANSEKYIICKDFKYDNSYDSINYLSKLYPILNSNNNIKRFLNIKIPYIYLNKLQDINAIIGQQQLENINSTLYLLNNNKQDKLNSIKKANIQKCILWCVKYKLPYNNINSANLFLSK
jgi:23S rRNA U2552 (ribose-2'-O)-methylase RlmE/FtsJ